MRLVTRKVVKLPFEELPVHIHTNVVLTFIHHFNVMEVRPTSTIDELFFSSFFGLPWQLVTVF